MIFWLCWVDIFIFIVIWTMEEIKINRQEKLMLDIKQMRTEEAIELLQQEEMKSYPVQTFFKIIFMINFIIILILGK